MSAIPTRSVLIRNVEIAGRRADVRLGQGQILAIIENPLSFLAPLPSERVLEANGGALLPGLQDHHIHLFSVAAALHSVRCGPPSVRSAEELEVALKTAATASGGWLRGIGYDESVAGDIDRLWLDQVLPSQPVRIQHRSGRLWIMNSMALELLNRQRHSPLERIRGRLTGRLYDADQWLRGQLSSSYPDVVSTCSMLAGYGVTGLTDASVSNDRATFEYLSGQVANGNIPQELNIMGGDSLPEAAGFDGIEVGAFKIHLHDHALPEIDDTVRTVNRAREQDRVVAFHCVTEAELVHALVALDAAGVVSGDRIEHAASAPPALIDAVADRGLTIVTQPNFVLERGDRYLRDIPADEHSWLYRGASWLIAGVSLAAGSDGPYGTVNPWAAMQAAVDRRTSDGHLLGADEALTPEQALDLYLSPVRTPGRNMRRVAIGEPADLCLLDRPWAAARKNLAAVRVIATIRNGRCIAGDTTEERLA